MPFKNPISIITGSLIAGDPSGAHIVIDETGIIVYNSSGSVVAQLSTNLGPNSNILNIDRITADEIGIGALSPVDGNHLSMLDLIYLYALDPAFTNGLGMGVKSRLQLYDTLTAVLTDPVVFLNGNKLIPDARHFQVGEATFGGSQALTTAFADIVSLSFTTLNANALAHVEGTIDNQVTAGIGAGGLTIGQIVIDGNTNTKQIVGDAVTVHRGNVSQSWKVPLAAAGAHTITLQGRKTINAGTVNAQVHTALTGVLFDMFA